MPVVFQQPEPMAPEIQSAGAAAQIMQQNNPTLARLYEQAMQGQTQASIAGANLAQRNMEARAQAANQGYAIEAQRQEHADALRAAQNVSPRDVFHAQQQQQAAEQHAMLQGWLQNQELSQSESMRLQRMQNAVGEVMSNPDLTDEEKTGLAMQLKTGIDPLRQRVERQKAAMDHELTTKAMNQVAQQEKIREMNDKMWADNAHNGVLEIPDANGTMHKYMRDDRGNPVEVGKPEKGAEAAMMRTDGVTAEQWFKHQEMVAKHVDKMFETEAKALEKEANNEVPGETIRRVLTGESRAERIGKEMDAMGLGRTFDSRPMARRPGATEGQTGQGGGLGSTEGAGQGTGEGARQPMPIDPAATRRVVDANPPFAVDAKDSSLAPAQRKEMAALATQRVKLQDADLPEKDKQFVRSALDAAEKLLAENGSYAGMRGKTNEDGVPLTQVYDNILFHISSVPAIEKQYKAAREKSRREREAGMVPFQAQFN